MDFLLMMAYSPAYFDVEATSQIICFWPPDMIPHPTIPGDEPKKPQTYLARSYYAHFVPFVPFVPV